MSQVSLGRPEFVPGTASGASDRLIPLCDFSLSVFFLSILRAETRGEEPGTGSRTFRARRRRKGSQATDTSGQSRSPRLALELL